MKQLSTSASKLYGYLQKKRLQYFPERQLFLRSEGRVRFLTIHSYTQVAISAALVTALGWGTVTSYAYLSRDFLIEDKNEMISTMTVEYLALSDDFSALEAEVDRRTRLLEERQQFLQELLTSAPAEAPSLLPVTDDPEKEKTAFEVDTSTQSPDPKEVKAEDISFFEGFFDDSEDTFTGPDNAERRKNLIARLQHMEAVQQNVASLLDQTIDHRLKQISNTIEPSGVTVDKLLFHAEGSGYAAGGPFVPESGFDGIFNAEDGNSFDQLRNSYDRLKMVTNALDSYPLGQPADKYYISSRFGGRIDPIKKVRARHYALDLSGWPGEPIKATAPGMVVKSASIWPYGNMVEIDHGNGFRTRYGHMRKLLVKKGEEVELGQQIGEMGSTGRVTGTHVHYEVWFDGKVIDPMPFMKAANNVLKIQGRYEKTSEQSD